MELVAKVRLEGIKLPVIMESASSNLLDNPVYEWLHFAACVQKPFPPNELLETVRFVLGSSSSTRQTALVLSSAMTAVLRGITPYPHWGLNE